MGLCQEIIHQYLVSICVNEFIDTYEFLVYTTRGRLTLAAAVLGP